MLETLGCAGHVGAIGVRRQGILAGAEHEVSAHACGEVDHNVNIGGAHALDDFGVELGVANANAGLRVANVDVHHCGASPSSIDGRLGDLLRSDRNMRAL